MKTRNFWMMTGVLLVLGLVAEAPVWASGAKRSRFQQEVDRQGGRSVLRCQFGDTTVWSARDRGESDSTRFTWLNQGTGGSRVFSPVADQDLSAKLEAMKGVDEPSPLEWKGVSSFITSLPQTPCGSPPVDEEPELPGLERLPDLAWLLERIENEEERGVCARFFDKVSKPVFDEVRVRVHVQKGDHPAEAARLTLLRGQRVVEERAGACIVASANASIVEEVHAPVERLRELQGTFTEFKQTVDARATGLRQRLVELEVQRRQYVASLGPNATPALLAMIAGAYMQLRSDAIQGAREALVTERTAWFNRIRD